MKRLGPEVVTIRRTKGRRYPLFLRAPSEDSGPYHLVDERSEGSSWLHRARLDGYRSWAPIFERALLAFALCDEGDDVGTAEAKDAADWVVDRTGRGGDAPEVVDEARRRLEYVRRRDALSKRVASIRSW